MTTNTHTAEYMRDYRRRNTDYAEQNRRKSAIRSRARARALSRLAKAHRAEYFQLFEEELRRTSVLPPITHKTPRRHPEPPDSIGGADQT